MQCTGRMRVKRTLWLLVGSSACSVLAVSGTADDKFIVQPKRQPAPVAGSVASTAAEAGQAASQQQRLEEDRQAAIMLTPSSPPSPGIVPPQAGAATNNTALRGGGGTAMKQSASPRDGLQWVTRGTSQPPRHSMVGGNTASHVALPDRASGGLAPTSGRPLQSKQHVAQEVPQEIAPQTASEQRQEERKVLAALVSNRIVSNIQPVTAPAIRPVDIAPGWRAVGERLTLHLRESDRLLRRNADLSARQEAETAANYLVRTLDLAVNSYSAEPHWQAAEQAFREAGDFYLQQSTDDAALRRIVDSHRTPVLKAVNLSAVSPLVAAQHYRQYALDNLVAASQAHPWASEVYCALGRTYQAEADKDPSKGDAYRARAATYYRAAVTISPGNALAANQLGFVLLQMDRPQEALQSLVAALQGQANEPALENLVEAARRLGDAQTQRWAMDQLMALRSNRPLSADVPPVTEVDVQTFIALSPHNAGPQASRTASLPNGAY